MMGELLDILRASYHFKVGFFFPLSAFPSPPNPHSQAGLRYPYLRHPPPSACRRYSPTPHPAAPFARCRHSPLPPSAPHPSAHLFAAAVIVIPPSAPAPPLSPTFSGRPALPLCYLLVCFCLLYCLYMYYVMLLSLSPPSICASSLSCPPIRSFVCLRRHRHHSRWAPRPSAPHYMLILRPACTTPMLFAFVLLSCILYCLHMYYVMPSSSHPIRSSSLSFSPRSILRPRGLPFYLCLYTVLFVHVHVLCYALIFHFHSFS